MVNFFKSIKIINGKGVTHHMKKNMPVWGGQHNKIQSTPVNPGNKKRETRGYSLNKIMYTEMQNTRKYKKIQGNAKKYKEIQRNAKKCNEMQRNTTKCKEIHGNARYFKEMQRMQFKFYTMFSLWVNYSLARVYYYNEIINK